MPASAAATLGSAACCGRVLMRLRMSEAQARRRIEDVLRLAQAGHRITLTRHGRPIAELGPARPAQPEWNASASRASPQLSTEGGIAAAIASGNDEQIVEAMRQAVGGIEKPGCDLDPTWTVGVVSIARSAVAVLGSPADAARWLLQPAIGLNRHRPIDMIRGGGIAEVALFLRRLEYEVYT